MMRTKGFTFGELLAVTVIVLIIVAMLFPVFAKHHEGGGPYSSCSSNQKQVGLAIMQYVQDNDECLPNIAQSPGSPITWRSMIFPYLKTPRYFQCPSRGDDKVTGQDGYPRSYAANYSGDYSGGALDRGQGAFAGPGAKAVNFAGFESPSTLIELCEVTDSGAPEFNIDDVARFGPAKHILWAGHAGPGYPHSANFLFADGHVKALLPTETASYATAVGYGAPANDNLWYRDGSRPLSSTGVAILAEAEKRGGARP